MALQVGDQFRTNPKSLAPGGYTVMVEYHDGTILFYDKIKNPNAYIDRVLLNSLVKDATVVKPENT
jgi:hypothetical protein